MLAVIKTGGKQYVVAPGQKLNIEKIEAAEGSNFAFEDVLLTADGDDIKIGNPKVPGVKVEARVLKQGRADKIIIFKYHSKTRYRKKRGHRQHFTQVEILKIV